MPWKAKAVAGGVNSSGAISKSAQAIRSGAMTAAGGAGGRCIGCGTCEYHCPLSGEAAIRVRATGG